MKADELWDKYAYRSEGAPYIPYTDFIRALTEYGELVKAEAVKIVNSVDNYANPMTANDCAAAIEKMELP